MEEEIVVPTYGQDYTRILEKALELACSGTSVDYRIIKKFYMEKATKELGL